MYGENVSEIRDRLQHTHETVRKHLSATFEYNRDSRLTRKPFRKFARGELVWHLDEYALPGEAPKLLPSYGGPCKEVCD